MLLVYKEEKTELDRGGRRQQQVREDDEDVNNVHAVMPSQLITREQTPTA